MELEKVLQFHSDEIKKACNATKIECLDKEEFNNSDGELHEFEIEGQIFRVKIKEID
jgi:hypothetical protein